MEREEKEKIEMEEGETGKEKEDGKKEGKRKNRMIESVRERGRVKKNVLDAGIL